MRILVPTDFSRFADYAVDAALQICERNTVEVHLLHCLDEFVSLEKSSMSQKKQDELLDQLTTWADEKLQELSEKFSKLNVDCHYFIKKGRLINSVKAFELKNEYDLVIMGSHGVSGKEEWFIGSNTQKVVRNLNNNILVLKNKFNYNYLNKAVFATGLDESDKLAFKKFLEFTKLFEIEEIHIVTIDTRSYFTQPTILVKEVFEDFKVLGEDNNVKTHFYPDYSITKGIEHFAKDFEIDLIGISNKVRHPIKRLLQGSNVELLVNHSSAPILSIDFKK